MLVLQRNLEETAITSPEKESPAYQITVAGASSVDVLFQRCVPLRRSRQETIDGAIEARSF
jgi:hypothetical protein